jgi:nicotinamidase/pyrazinamidase
MAQALLIVDLQNDFLPGGALAVPAGDEVIAPINALAADPAFALTIATRDWHPAEHSSFVAQGGPWPAHCVQDTFGAELDERLDLDRVDVILDKGIEPSASGYSAFERPELTDLLASHGIDAVTVVGLATDFCVVHTAQGALDAGLEVTVDRAGIRGIDAAGSERALADLTAGGARIR